MRLCAFGDSYVNGTGDGDCQGWIGRVVARARRAGREITLYNLGMRGDTSEDIALRWAGEAARRLPPFAPMRLAFSFGANDCTPHGPAARVPLARSIENTESILRQALRMAPTIVIGPVPVLDDAQTDRRIQILSVAQERVCESLFIAGWSDLAAWLS